MGHPGRKAKLAITVAVAVAASALCPLTASAAQARHTPRKPRLTWTLPASGDANTPIGFSWTATKVPAGSHLVIQQPEGTAKVWRTIAKLRTAKGSSSLSGLSIGKDHRYRLALLSRHGQLLADVAHSVNIFGQVSLARLDGDPTGSNGGTYTSPTSSFPYEFGSIVFNSTTIPFTVAARSNDCKSVYLQFEVGTDVSEWSSMGAVGATATVVQQSENPTSASTPFNTVGSLTAQVIPGQSWSVEETYSGISDNDAFDNLTIYLNGYGICDSTQAVISGS